MSFRFQFRRGTTAERDASNPILAAGEPAVVLDSGQPAELVLGDGATAMADLRAAVWDDDARLAAAATAVQPAALAGVAATIPDAPADIGAATAAQGAKADAAVPLTKAGHGALTTVDNAAMRPWLAALANRDTAAAKVYFMGDSITEGRGSTLRARRFSDRVGAQIRRTLGVTGGARGFIGADRSTNVGAWGTEWTYAGGPGGASGVGPARYAKSLTSGMTASIVVTGTSVDVWTCKTSGGGTINVSVDGGATVATINTSGASLIDGQVTRVSLGASGAHTLLLTHASGGSAFVGGVVLLFGARMAGGCTSGHGISGGLQLAVSSWTFFMSMFASGVVMAWLMFSGRGRAGVAHV